MIRELSGHSTELHKGASRLSSADVMETPTDIQRYSDVRGHACEIWKPFIPEQLILGTISYFHNKYGSTQM
ncbi:hypothetical protein Y032_0004g1836 [Ancylostoma ceylanicum]|uniref:Uncharacterized protein n=1 Tax=Ancylostoma ceylanicum TaxID=53326 RepID=A0A016VU06_9BILA|nr:hypothetical protein Y032_0004g1836 [Ancylostoma ceylanicum]